MPVRSLLMGVLPEFSHFRRFAGEGKSLAEFAARRRRIKCGAAPVGPYGSQALSPGARSILSR